MNKIRMKYTELALLSVLITTLLFSFLSKEPCSATLVYSNLADEASIIEVKGALHEAGLSERVVKDFFQQVYHFNAVIENTSLTDSFTEIRRFEADYEKERMLKLITRNEPDYLGYNSRLTAYTLMRDFIQVDQSIYEDDPYLAMDIKAMKAKNALFNSDEFNTYNALFTPIVTERTSNIPTHVARFRQYLNQNDIRFRNSDKASLVFVVFHNLEEESSKLFIGHVGVLLPQKEGGYLFIEKLNFEQPYQAIKFKGKQCLNDYLMIKYEKMGERNQAKPFIMENGELLKEYRSKTMFQGVFRRNDPNMRQKIQCF